MKENAMARTLQGGDGGCRAAAAGQKEGEARYDIECLKQRVLGMALQLSPRSGHNLFKALAFLPLAAPPRALIGSLHGASLWQQPSHRSKTEPLPGRNILLWRRDKRHKLLFAMEKSWKSASRIQPCPLPVAAQKTDDAPSQD